MKPKLIDKKIINKALARAKELEKKHVVTKKELEAEDSVFLKQAKKAFSLLEKLERGYKK